MTTTADAALRSWTGEDFGIRLAMGVPSLDANATEKVATEADAKLAEGVRRWKEWWQKHEAEYPQTANSSAETRPSLSRLPVADFELSDLSGKPVKLSGFRGKVVLLNFWTTWCTACLIEIPNLIELQRRNELPTNVLIDREGYIRRRFLGGRSVAVFEAMIRELEPAGSTSK